MFLCLFGISLDQYHYISPNDTQNRLNLVDTLFLHNNINKMIYATIETGLKRELDADMVKQREIDLQIYCK